MFRIFWNGIVKQISCVKQKLRCGFKDKTINDQIPNYLENYKNKIGGGVDKQLDTSAEFRKRYVNVIKEEGNFIIFLSWSINDNAMDYIECCDQWEAEIVMEVLKAYYWHYGSVIVKYDGIPCYLNIDRNNGNIIIRLAPEKKDKSHEIICCLGMDEAMHYIEKLRVHYEEYGNVIIENEFEMEKDHEDFNFGNY